MNPFLRHIAACNTARLPGERVPFHLGGAQVGWLRPDLAEAVSDQPHVQRSGDGVTLTQPAELAALARTLSDDGYYRWRGEAFDVRAVPDGTALAQIDRGALPAFGIQATGAHVNGLVRTADGLKLWVARRSASKLLDPGKLDHIVAGGVSAGMTPFETLIKESAEEAAIPAGLAAQAVPVARIGYAMERPEGLRRDWLHCYDLTLPEEFVPHPADGEVAGFELWPVARAFEAVRDSDAFKFNVNLVLIDLFLRLRMIQGADAEELRAGLNGSR